MPFGIADSLSSDKLHSRRQDTELIEFGEIACLTTGEVAIHILDQQAS